MTDGDRRHRRVLARCAAGVVLTLGLATSALAQGTAPARPDFRVLRFEEDWSVLRGREVDWPLDRLKYLPLSGDGGAYLSLGGQTRFRTERVSDFLLLSGEGQDDVFSLHRTFLHADLHLGRPLRVFVEGKHALAFGRELPGGRRPLDQDEWDLQNAFVELACCGDGASRVSARVGRQELLFGSQRLVSPLDWANTRRTFDGARLMAALGGVAIDGFWTRPVVVRVEEPNRADDVTDFWGATLRPRTPGSGLTWEAYALVLQQDDVALWGYEGEHDRVTLGGRLLGPLGSPGTRFELEGGWQAGELADEGVRAFFLASELRRSFAALPAAPAVALGLDYASGDADPEDGRVGTFHQLYPLGHAYAGFMDVLGRQNLVEARGVLTATPFRRVTTRIAAHHFLRARTEDAAYGVGGAVLRPAATSPARTLGTELDLTAALQAGRYLRIEGGYGHFVAGDFLRASPNGADDSDWLFGSATVTF